MRKVRANCRTAAAVFFSNERGKRKDRVREGEGGDSLDDKSRLLFRFSRLSFISGCRLDPSPPTDNRFPFPISISPTLSQRQLSESRKDQLDN